MTCVDPAPGSPEELSRFAELQARLGPLFDRVLPDPRAPRTVVIVPALSLDPDLLGKIKGVRHYEERLLCMLLLLRLPNTRVIYVTSTAVDRSIIDYYLHLLPGVPSVHARRRLELVHCHDASLDTVTEKLLARPRLLRRVQRAIGDPRSAHMTCFHVTEQERSLAVRLGIPIFGCDPELARLGSKSGSRGVFREAGVHLPRGCEDLRDEHDMASALTELRRTDASLCRAAVKLDYGTSGEGNAVFDYSGCPAGAGVGPWVRSMLPERLRFEGDAVCWDAYRAKFADSGGIVEAWIDGDAKRSPSMQGRIDPLGRVELISTHEQVLGGPSGQIFVGSAFPAHEPYRREIQDAGLRVGEVLRRHDALGRFAVDFVAVREADGWRNYAIEINLRKGGTTHTFRTLQFLTDGRYDERTGLFMTSLGVPRYYYASDNVQSEDYRRLTPDDLIDIAVENALHFDAATQEGVFFHLIGALSGYGKLGLLCVAGTAEGAFRRYQQTIRVLDAEALA